MLTLESVLEKNKYSDLLVICGADRYPVHRAIVCPRSTWFEDKCEQNLAGPDHSSPATPLKIWLDPGEEPHIIAAVLTYLYTLDYSPDGPSISFGLPHDRDSIHSQDSVTTESPFSHDFNASDNFSEISHPRSLEDEDDGVRASTSTTALPTSEATVDQSPRASSTAATLHDNDPGTHPNALTLHSQLFLAAHRFGIPPLANIAKDKFNKALHSSTSTADLISCIREVYRQQSHNSSACTLKSDVVKVCRSRFRKLKEEEGWEGLIIEFPEFAADILRGL